MQIAVLATVALLAGPAPSSAVAQDQGPDELERWLAYLLPSEDELAWRAIPWRDSFWLALEEARAGDRPLLLWAMNGHPLGCT